MMADSPAWAAHEKMREQLLRERYGPLVNKVKK